MKSDKRYLSIKSRLCLLPSEALQKFLSYDRPIVYDELNYRPEDDAYCPLAIMLDVENALKTNSKTPSQEIVLNTLKEHKVFGTVKGISGEFYRNERENDIKNLCREILNERKDIESINQNRR